MNSSNLPALANSPYALRIKTTTGEEIQLAPGHSAAGIGQTSVADMLPGGGDKPLPRLIIVQPRDARGIDSKFEGEFMLQQSEQSINEQGENEWVKVYSASLGRQIQIRVVGYNLERVLMPDFDHKAVWPDANKPLCRSTNFLAPDAQFDGKFSHECMMIDPKRGGLVAACAMAAWGKRDPATKKSDPPKCNETYVIAAMVKVDNAWVTCEVALKSSSAKTGRTLIQQLRALELRGYPLYTYPIELWGKEVGQGNAMVGRLLIPPSATPEVGGPDEADIDALQTGVERWAAALAYRAELSLRTYDEDAADEETPAPSEMMGDMPADKEDGHVHPLIDATVAPKAPQPPATKRSKKDPMV